MTLYCNGTGNPSPQIAWIKSGKVLVTDSVREKLTEVRLECTSVWFGMES